MYNSNRSRFDTWLQRIELFIQKYLIIIIISSFVTVIIMRLIVATLNSDLETTNLLNY